MRGRYLNTLNCGFFFFCLMIWSLSWLTFGLGKDPSLSSALELAFQQFLLLFVRVVCHVRHDWHSLIPFSLCSKKRRHAAVRWMDMSPFSFSCVACQDFGHLQRADNPHGAAKAADGERASHSCSRNVHFCLFFLFSGGSGDIIVHHILVADEQLWKRRTSATCSSSFFFFLSAKMRQDLCKGHCDDASRSHTLWMNLLMYVGCNGFRGHLSLTSSGVWSQKLMFSLEAKPACNFWIPRANAACAGLRACSYIF